MSEITLVSRELTFTDMEFQEADITSKDKLQNIVKTEVDRIVIEQAAKNKNGEYEKVLISYDFSN